MYILGFEYLHTLGKGIFWFSPNNQEVEVFLMMVVSISYSRTSALRPRLR